MVRGSVVWVDLPRPAGQQGREQIGKHPAIIIQNAQYDANLATVVVVPITSPMTALRFPGARRIIATQQNGLDHDSVALPHQVTAVDKRRLCGTAGRLSLQDLQMVEEALRDLICL